MTQEFLTQRSFTERCDNGEKEFSNVIMQFFDISNKKFDGIKISNSKVLFCTFRSCDFSNAMFDNCEVYCGSFYNGTLSNTSFSKCKMELTLFESIQFNRTKMDRCNIRLCAIFNSNHASVDFSTSTQSRLLTDVSQITRADIEQTVNETMADIERLDVGTRMKLKEIIRQDMQRYGLQPPEEKKGAYDVSGKGHDDSPLTYGEVRGLLESTFGAYGAQGGYKTKKTRYETGGKYK